MHAVQTFASQFGNSVKTNNVKGFRTATPKVVLAQADELLANITVMNELKLEDHIVDILEVCMQQLPRLVLIMSSSFSSCSASSSSGRCSI